MTKRLEEEFNLPPLNQALGNQIDKDQHVPDIAETQTEIQLVHDAISISEKVNSALSQIKGLEQHESEMDEVANMAIDSYEKLMDLGMNVSDMAAGKVFSEASNMLKIALEAKDAKTKRKLDQIELMLKKIRVDKLRNHGVELDDNVTSTQTFDRNDLLKLMKEARNDK
jgi:hypothetical protein